MRNLLIVVLSITVLMAVGCAKAPKCSDKDVKNTATELAKEIIERKILNGDYKAVLFSKDGKNVQEAAGVIAGIVVAKEFVAFAQGLKGEPITMPTPLTLDELKKDEKTAYIAKNIENELKDIKIESIRTCSENKEIKKSVCEGDLVFASGDKLLLEYSAQTTDDGSVRVEVKVKN